MSGFEDNGATLEGSDGSRIDLRANCSFGRASGNSVVVESAKTSRRHAVIHLQNIGEFWLVDLGSTNGTLLNGRRLLQPVQLVHNDQITIGDTVFKFYQPQELSKEYKTTIAQRTIGDMEHLGCWLLLADIEDFTPLSRTLPVERLATFVGDWMAACKHIVEGSRGSVNKYLGDGMLAYWREEGASVQNLAETITAFKQLQNRAILKFRFVLHFGRVAVGGMVSMGEESLMGKEVNLVFRLEKLAASLKQRCTVSDGAARKLKGSIPLRSLGQHAIKGFDAKCELFAI